MKYKLLFWLSLSLNIPLFAEEVKPSNWHFFSDVSYSARSLDGTLINKTEKNNDHFGELLTTGKAMNVGTSSSAMMALGMQYKRFGIGLNYLPTSFEGQGTALVAASGENAGVFIRTPLDTRIDVEMLLTNVYYNVIQTPDTVFGVGLGLGETNIDFNITPQLGNKIAYTGTQPFGFVSLHFSTNYNSFIYGFALSGISAAFSGVNVKYSDYKVNLGYRVYDKTVKVDIMGGYRLVNFAVIVEADKNKTASDFSLSGPFLGITVTY